MRDRSQSDRAVSVSINAEESDHSEPSGDVFTAGRPHVQAFGSFALANMVAGHLVLLAILGLIVAAAEDTTTTTASYATVTVISVVGSTLLSCLELFVAFLQAYVFTFLAALFFGGAVHHH
jgi:hypothetical protein